MKVIYPSTFTSRKLALARQNLLNHLGYGKFGSPKGVTFQYGTLGLNIIDMGILCPPTEWVRVRAKFLAASRGVRPPVLVGFLLANQKLGALARAESGDSGSCPWARMDQPVDY